VEETAYTFYGDKEAFYVMRKHYRAHWQSYANFLSGSMTYGEFFSEQESIRESKEDQIAEIERRQKYAADERKKSIEDACASAGGRWTGYECDPVLGDPDRKIYCTTNGSTTTCSR
jgi:hypothetical protein